MLRKIDCPEMTELQLVRTYKTVREEWESNLKDKRVLLPPERELKSKAWHSATLQLLILRKYMGDFVSKEGLSELILHLANYKADQQARHLGPQRGFYVIGTGSVMPDGTPVPRGYYVLVNMTEARPNYSPDKRDAIRNPKYQDGTKCSTCSAVHGQPHPRDRTKIAKMEAGHRDPTKNLLKDNAFPQCQLCNRPTKDDIVWGEGDNPLPVALGSPALVKKSSLDVRKSIYGLLRFEPQDVRKEVYNMLRPDFDKSEPTLQGGPPAATPQKKKLISHSLFDDV